MTNSVIFSMIRFELMPRRWQNFPKRVSSSGFSSIAPPSIVSVALSFSSTPTVDVGTVVALSTFVVVVVVVVSDDDIARTRWTHTQERGLEIVPDIYKYIYSHPTICELNTIFYILELCTVYILGIVILMSRFDSNTEYVYIFYFSAQQLTKPILTSKYYIYI